MKKREVKAIRNIAKLLPEMTWQGITPRANQRIVNHVLRLKRAYKKQGQLGIIDYCKKVGVISKRVSEIWLERLCPKVRNKHVTHE